MRTRLSFFVVGLVGITLLAALVLAQGKKADQQFPTKPVLTFDNQGPGPSRARLVVQVRGPLTDYKLNKLNQYGAIQLKIERYNAVAIAPKGVRAERTIRSLPFVQFVEKDQPRWLTDVGSWDRDILDAVDMEEISDPGPPYDPADPDPREVDQTGAGVQSTAALSSAGGPSWTRVRYEPTWPAPSWAAAP
jgi:hypothetical protein